MNDTRLSSRVRDFLDQHKGRPTEYQGIRIHIRDNGERLVLFLEIPQRATSRAMHHAIAELARVWKELLEEYQGEDETADDKQLGTYLALVMVGDRTYKEIANELNHTISELMCKGFAAGDTMTLPSAKAMLALWGYRAKGADVERLLVNGIGRIRKGKQPFEDDPPFDAERVRNKLNTIKRKRYGWR